MSNKLLLVATSLLLSAYHVYGNARLVCPAPQSANAGRQEATCLPFSPTAYTDLTPGPLTIKIEEVATHAGSPMRLEIFRANGRTPCLLVDHIPSNPTSRPSGNCPVNDYPVGQCTTGSTYSLTVNIPDVACAQCQLRLTYVNMDSANGTRRPCTTSNCTTYYSCADIKIRGQHTLQEACPVTQGSWPYRPLFTFSADLRPGNEVPPVNTSTASGTATISLRDNTLTYTISYRGISQFAAAHFHGPAPQTANADVQYTISEFTKPGGSDEARGEWTNLTPDQIQDLKDGLYYINIHSNDFPDGEIRGQVLITASNYVLGVYTSESGDYNKDGWLSGRDFVGSSASASRFVVGFGPCATDSKCFGTVLKSGNSMDVVGTAAVQTTSTRAWFGLDVANRPQEISSVTIGQNDAYDSAAIDLTDLRRTPAHVMGVLELTPQQLNALEKGGLQVTVAFSGSSITVTGKLEQGMIAMLANEFEVPKSQKSPQSVGTAFLRFRRDTALLVDMTVTGLNSKLTKAHIHGPGRQGQMGPLLFDLSAYIHNLSVSDAHVTSSVSNLLADHVRYLWENRLYINMHTELAPTGELRNQICTPGTWQCSSTDTINLCFVANLNVDQEVPAVQLVAGPKPSPSGLAGTKFDRLGDLYYSIALHNINKADITSAHIHGPAAVGETAPALVVIDHTQFAPTAGQRDNVLKLSASAPLTDQQKTYASDGLLYFNVHTNDHPDGLVRGQLPRVRRSRCAAAVQETAVASSDGTQGFMPGHPYEDLRLLQGDRLVFRYPGTSSVNLLENQNRYEGCAYLNSDIVGETDSNVDTLNVTFVLEEAKTYYFAGNEGDCNANPPMKFRVEAVARLDSSQLLSNDTCQSTSFAAAVVAKESSGSLGSEVIAAAFIGLAVGTVVVVVVFVFNYRRAKSGTFDVKA